MTRVIDEKEATTLRAQGIPLKTIEPDKPSETMRQITLLRTISAQLDQLIAASPDPDATKTSEATVLTTLRAIRDGVKELTKITAAPKPIDDRDYKVEARRNPDGTMTARIWRE